MYEVAPYTSHVAFTLVSPGKQHMKHATPQIYARYNGYPTLSEYDATTAVNGNAWQVGRLRISALETLGLFPSCLAPAPHCSACLVFC